MREATFGGWLSYTSLVAITLGLSERTLLRCRCSDSPGVTATINFDDDGTTLKIRGHASGMDPDTSYISLIYDERSVDEGEFACEPTIFAPPAGGGIIDRIFVGVWKVLPNGNGTLRATNLELDGGTKVYVSPADFRTISVRIGANGDLVACGVEG